MRECCCVFTCFLPTAAELYVPHIAITVKINCVYRLQYLMLRLHPGGAMCSV